jgi:broad specificity phosphatase PhoE
VRRLLLVRHAATSATRTAAFPADEPIEARAAEAAARLRDALPRRAVVVASPALRCRQTAAAARLETIGEPLIAECDFGRWAGRTLRELHAETPGDVGAWMGHPDAAPHGGESLAAFAMRVARWLAREAADDGTTVAITHGGVVKAAVVHALGAPLDAFWRVDVAPLTISELHAHDGRWTVARVNCALAPEATAPGAEAGAPAADAEHGTEVGA